MRLMFTRDELPRNDRLSNPITVLVRDISPSSSNKLDFEVTVEDADGYTIPLKIWVVSQSPLEFSSNWLP